MKIRSNHQPFYFVTDLPLPPLSFFQKTLDIKKNGIPQIWRDRLKGKTALLYFEEPSTRTRMSFELAAQRLGMNTLFVSSSSSSFSKGESRTEFMRFISEYNPTVIVMRTSAPLLPNFSSRMKSIVINAGSGSSAHPSQALLDYVTLLEHLGKVTPLRIGFCGDLSRSRVFRSHLRLAHLIKGIEVGIYSPFPFGDVDGCTYPIKKFGDKDSFFKFSEVVCVLRNQAERSSGLDFLGGAREDFVLYHRLHAKEIPHNTTLLHPGPIHFETDMEHVILDRDKTVVDEQVENGIYTRICLMGVLYDAMEPQRAAAKQAGHG